LCCVTGVRRPTQYGSTTCSRDRFQRSADPGTAGLVTLTCKDWLAGKVSKLLLRNIGQYGFNIDDLDQGILTSLAGEISRGETTLERLAFRPANSM